MKTKAEDMKPKRRAKIEFKKTKAGAQKGEWRYTIKAANGEKLVTSEGHGSKRDAQRGLDTLIALLTNDIRIANDFRATATRGCPQRLVRRIGA